MTWIAFAAGWLLGSATLYLWMVTTAKEPQKAECMDCVLPECEECPHLMEATAADRRAA